jgi:uridine kinase
MIYNFNTCCVSFCRYNNCTIIHSYSRSISKYNIDYDLSRTFSISNKISCSYIEEKISYLKYKNSICLTLFDIEIEVSSILE